MLFLAVPLTASAQTTFATTAVGRQSQPVPVTVTMTGSAMVTQASVVTEGIAGLDFQVAPGGSCQTLVTYIAGQQCTVNVIFAPLYPGVRNGAVVIKTATGVLASTSLTGNATGPLAVLEPGDIQTIAGDYAWVFNGDGVLATTAPIFLPTGVAEDSGGNIFISDSNNNRIRRVDFVTGLISTVGGDGSPGYSGDGGPATQAMISNPGGLLIDGGGNIYFADTGNHAIRRIDAVTGIITTVAGVPTVQGYSGDNGAATSAMLSLPEGLGMDGAGNLYIADTGNNVVREVKASTGIITTIAGTGVAGYSGDGGAATGAQLNSPWSVTVAADGSLYVADLKNNSVRHINLQGKISTSAGNGQQGFSGDGGLATAAELNGPASVAFDPAGNLYIADSTNNRIRKVSVSTGDIQTIAGTSGEQFDGDGGEADMASLYGPYSVFFDQSGNLLIADLFHNRIRAISATPYTLPAYATIRVGKVSAPQKEGLENDGNADLLFPSSNFDVLNNAALDPATTTCNPGSDLPSGNDCTLGVDFAPTVIGTSVLGTVTLNSNAANTPTVLNLSGQVLTVNPTSISVASGTNPSVLGDNVTFTATVTSSATNLTGTVTFFDGTTQLCSVGISANVATCSTSSLTQGPHSITADYSGDSQDAAANSAVLTQVVKQQSTAVLNVSPNPAIIGNTVTLTATVTAPTGTPTGTVTFYDDTVAVGSSNLNTSGVAVFYTTTLAVGTHPLSVQYMGDANNASTFSSREDEVIQLATSSTTLGASASPVTVGTSVTFTATVVSVNGQAPTGTVTFTEGTTVLGTSQLNGSGTAMLTTSALTPGSNPIIATYAGDGNNSTSASAAFTETVTTIPTVETLTSNVNPASAGQTVVLTANTAIAGGATADGAISGQVTFTNGANTLGVIAVDANGNAVLNINTLPVGLQQIIATYSGNTNYASAATAAFPQTIQITGSTTVGSTSTPNVLAGLPAVLNATVSSTSGTPTGTVTFYDGTAVVGTATLNPQGMATLSTSTLSVGTHTLKVVYGGSPSYTSSTSATFTITVSLATTSLTLTGPSAPVDAGTPANFSSTLSSNNGVAPTGTLSLRDGSTVVASQPVTADGTFAFTLSNLTLGTHTLTTSYSGDANNAATVSPAFVLVVQQAATTTALVSSANPSPLGQPVTLTATISSDGPNISGTATFEDGGAVIGTASVSNGTASFTTSTLGFGSHNLTVVYSGDTNHITSTSAALTEQITEVTNENLSSSLNPATAGLNVVFTATIAAQGGNVPTGTVVFTDGGATLGSSQLHGSGSATLSTATLSVGTHTIVATYSGDQNDAPATATLLETIQSASTQVAIAASSNPATYNAPETFTATVTSNGGSATGTITFTDGGTPIGTGTLNGNGVASLTLSSLSPGTHSIVANYPGDGRASASVSTPLAITVQEVTSVAMTSSSNPALTLAPIVLTATVSNAGIGTPTGTVTFMDGTTQLGVGTLSGGSASITLPSLAAGQHPLQVLYAGDSTNFAGTSAQLSETVQLRPTTTSVASTQTNPADTQQVTLIASVAWTGPVAPTGNVTFQTGSTVIGTEPLNGSGEATINIELSSSENVTATYNADAVYASSTSAVTAITGGGVSQFSITLSPSSMSMQSGQHGSVTVTMSSVHNFADTLQFGCLGLPVDATCTFSSTQSTLAANGTMSVTLTVDTGDPLGAGGVAKNVPGRSNGVMLCFVPLGLLASLVFFRSRRRSLPLLVLLLAAMVGTLSLSGCGGLQMNSTPAGTYNFKVSASGKGTGVTQTQNMTLTVTQ